MPKITVFSLLLNLCGLKQREAAEILGVSLDTVKSWSTGKQGRAPEWAIKTLREFYWQASCLGNAWEKENPLQITDDPSGRLQAAIILSCRTDYPELKVLDTLTLKVYIDPEAIEQETSL